MIYKVFPVRLLTAVALLSINACTAANCEDNREEAMGRKYALEVEKQYTLVNEPVLTERVEQIGNTLASIANKMEVPATYGSSDVMKFNYKFAIVKEKDANAFSLPGGKIFVNTGLLELAVDDSELAGVLAHEIAHAAHHHVVRLMNEQSKIDRYVALIALVGILGKANGRDIRNIMMGADMVRQGKLSGYTMQAEEDADRTAVAYLAKSPYEPLGIVSFMRKLEKLHDENPTLPLGIYQTHPAPYRRVASIQKALMAAGINVDMRKFRGIAYAGAVESSQGSGKYNVMLCGKVFYSPSSLGIASSSKARADELSKAINSALDSGIKPKDIAVDKSGNCLTAKGQVILKIEADDLNGPSDSSQALMDRARQALLRATWADWLMNTCSTDKEYELKSK